MAHHKSALKRILIAEKRNIRNRVYRSKMKTAIKQVRQAANKEEGQATLVAAYSIIDKLAIKGILSKNTAANKKSRLTRFVNTLS